MIYEKWVQFNTSCIRDDLWYYVPATLLMLLSIGLMIVIPHQANYVIAAVGSVMLINEYQFVAYFGAR